MKCKTQKSTWQCQTYTFNLNSPFFVFWYFTSVQFSHSVVSNSLRPHEPQQARLPCPSPTPRVYPNSCPLSWWCHPTISSSVIPFSSHLQSFPASGFFFFFQMSQCFTQGGQSIWVSASTSVLPMNTQNWFPSWFPDILLNSNEIMCRSVQDNMRCHPSTYPKCFFLFSSLTIIRQPDLTFIWEPTIITASFWKLSFPGGSAGKESACNEGDLGYLPGLGRFLGERKAIHSSILAWRGPWTV